MAGGQEIRIMGYKFKTRPKFALRRILCDFVPYLQASKPSFVVIVTGENDDNPKREIQFFTILPDGHNTNVIYDIPHLKKGQKVILNLPGSFQALNGDVKIIVGYELKVIPQGINPEQYYTLYSFHVIPKTWFTLAVIAGSFAGVLNAISLALINN